MVDMKDVGKATRVLSSVVGVTVIAYGIYLLTAKEAPEIDETPVSSLEESVSSSSESTTSPFAPLKD
ncbi:hypothetical protein SAMN04488700_1392 [Carnobacterium iners]|uniref:Uncharacterized protein n=1 Tax=Carnobacterium iners TaxID=1073423 RepID=A0A1X7N536_9LACT|nr:hypothetical protein [Carnobacterium iners]SEL28841.1 hypothetical protein SAMN04488114_1469 [Carnobacterium iners]SMH32414.1 hypothetical protein SAMN04488700_1392 [Carnobacterium iners]